MEVTGGEYGRAEVTFNKCGAAGLCVGFLIILQSSIPQSDWYADVVSWKYPSMQTLPCITVPLQMSAVSLDM